MMFVHVLTHLLQITHTDCTAELSANIFSLISSFVCRLPLLVSALYENQLADTSN